MSDSKKQTISEEEKEQIETAVVEELNQILAIVHTSTTHILIEKGGNEFVLDSKSSLITLYQNQLVCVGDKALNKATIWLNSPKRRTFDKIVFNPRIEGHYEGNYNIWKGFAVTPKQGDCSLFWLHVKQVICTYNEGHYQYVRKWLAHLIQKPWIVATALVLRGKQGTGKGTFADTIGVLLGAHYAPLSSLDRILGRFNAHLQNAILIYADEAIWGGNKKDQGALKALITEKKLFIEAKGKDGYWIDNYKHLIVSSNEDWAVPLDPDDRRFFVLDVSSEKKEDIEYFAALHRQLESRGYAALLYDLLNEDISTFDPKIMPPNYTGFDMKLTGAPSIDRFIYAALKEGYWNHTLLCPTAIFQQLPIQDFYSYYKSWCHSENQTTMTQEQVGRRLRQIFPELQRKRPSTKDIEKRQQIYVFQTIEECRSAFEKFYKQNTQIWE